MSKVEDMQTLQQARPYIRSILAFILKLRYNMPQSSCYGEADGFLAQLKEDVKANTEY